MPYIKLLTALTALALLTACGGGTADKAGGDTTDCKANPFAADCLTNNAPALVLRQNMCLTNDAIHSTCDEVIVGVCEANPFQSTACLPDDTYLSARISACIKYSELDREAKGNCTIVTNNTTMNPALIACLANPFATACESVPAFMSSFADARTNLASFCNDSDNATDDLCKGDNVRPICRFDPFTAICPDATYGTPRQEACLADIMTNPACTGEMGIATLFCKDDPFHDSPACMADTYLPERIADCITDGNADETRCPLLFTAPASKACLTNPFTDACKADGAFGTYADMARTNRVSFCETAGNDSNTLCMDTILTNLCEFSAFSTACTGQPNTPDLRVASCLDANIINKDPSCTEVLLVNHDDYLASFGDTPPLATVLEAAEITAVLSHFLSVGVNGIDTTRLATSSLDDTKPMPLTLSRAGDPMDGVTYVIGNIIEEVITESEFLDETQDVTQSFVGLLPTTDLGAPLPSTTADATWVGSYYIFLNNATHDITFTIDFEEGTIDATDTQASLTTIFDLDFTATGVITGDVNFGNVGADPDDTAQARGLIGEQGLVGGFANTDAGTRGVGLYGGFVAVPPDPCITLGNCRANHAAYLANIGDTPPPATLLEAIANTGIRSHFVSVGADGIDTTGLVISDADRTEPMPLTLSRAGDADDGVTYVTGIIEFFTQSFVGLLPSTDLGAPLPSNTADATWTGSYYARPNSATNNITFTIDFEDGEIDGTDTRGNNITTFDLDFTATGVITGNVRFQGSGLDDTAPVRGLIGEQGLVGGFANTDTGNWGSGLYGGFVADNPNYTAPE